MTAALTTVPSGWHSGDGGGPGPWFLLFPLTFWLVVAILGTLYWRRRGTHRPSGEQVLADLYARGDFTEEDYRARLGVLRETRR